MRNLIPSMALVAVFAACSSDDPPAPPTAAAAAPVEPADPSTAAETFAPITSRQFQPTPADGTPIAAPGILFVLPAGWTSESPSSGMRLAQAVIPGADGNGQLTVFYFGAGGGGGVENNLQRWVGQVELDPGSQPRRETFSFDTFKVTWIDIQGTLKPSTMGTGPSTPQTGYRMLAAVVEGNQGPWYFKATGPAQTLAAQRQAFLDMLRSATPHG